MVRNILVALFLASSSLATSVCAANRNTQARDNLGNILKTYVTYLVLNVFLLLIAFRILGWKFCAKTIYGVAIFAAATRFIETHTVGMTPLLHDQPFMATVIGSFFMGSSAGLGLGCNGSTGGSDTVAAMITKYYNISLGHVLMVPRVMQRLV